MQRDPNIHRELHALVQGTPAWDAYRANHDNASDAPAMMSCSPYKTRSELIRQYATGLSPEIDARTQKLFDDGHRFEELARNHVAELNLIGMELYPNIASLGRLSASYDGLTMCESIVWEHKSLNNDIRACEAAAELPLMYRIQMEQQMHIVGAEKALFSATRWDDGDNLLEEKHFWYEPDMALRQQIIDGWEQFALDVAAYVPQEVAEKPAAEVIMALPALIVQTRGEVVRSNLPDFQAAATAFIAKIKTDLATDEDFANAEATVKFCSDAERDLEATKASVLGQAATIDAVMKTIDNISGQLRSKRLVLEKLVMSKKQQIKEGILAAAKVAYTSHVDALEAEIKPLRLPAAAPDFAGAMKNKRTLASLQDAVDTLLANAKISTNATAADYRSKQAWCKESVAGFGHLFADMATIITKPMDDFQLVVTTRVDAHKAAELAKAEALRASIAAEEKKKADAVIAEAARVAQVAADAQAAAAVEAERTRVAAETKRQMEAQQATIAAERQANEQAAAARADRERMDAVAAVDQRTAVAAAENVADDGRAAALADQGRLADAAEELAAAKASPAGAELSPAATDLFAQEGEDNFARAHIPPTLRLGQINERLAPLQVSVDGLRTLGFEPADTDRAAKLYHEVDFKNMCAAMYRHISSVQAKHA